MTWILIRFDPATRCLQQYNRCIRYGQESLHSRTAFTWQYGSCQYSSPSAFLLRKNSSEEQRKPEGLHRGELSWASGSPSGGSPARASLLAGSESSWVEVRKATTQFGEPERGLFLVLCVRELLSCCLKCKPLWWHFSDRFTSGKNLVSQVLKPKSYFQALCLLYGIYFSFKCWLYFKVIPSPLPLQKLISHTK